MRARAGKRMVPPARFELAAPGLGNRKTGLARGLEIHVSHRYNTLLMNLSVSAYGLYFVPNCCAIRHKIRRISEVKGKAA